MAPPRGREFVTLCDFFLILLFFFLRKRPDHISRPICTRNVSFDVDFYKEVPFGDYNPQHSYCGGPRPLKPPKYSPGIGIPMSISMLNYIRRVTSFILHLHY